MRMLLVAAILTAACGGEEPSDDGPCLDRSGLYRLSYSEKSGNCGPINDSVINLSAAPGSMAEGCTGQGYPPGMCGNGVIDVSCPVEGGLYTVRTRGTMHWRNDATVGSASNLYMELSVARTGTIQCSGFYRMTMSKQ